MPAAVCGGSKEELACAVCSYTAGKIAGPSVACLFSFFKKKKKLLSPTPASPGEMAEEIICSYTEDSAMFLCWGWGWAGIAGKRRVPPGVGEWLCLQRLPPRHQALCAEQPRRPG